MRKIYENKKVIKVAENLILIMIFIAVVIPFFVTIKYALFVTDDFPLANAVVRNYDGNYFKVGLKCATNYWHKWNGNWFSFFVGYGLHPLVRGGQRMLASILRVHFLLAIIGTAYVCFSLTKFFELKVDKALRIFALVVIPILSFKEYFDLYMWWLTSCTYLMPLYCFLYGFGTYLFALKSNKVWQYAVSGLFLLFMSGGSLNVVGMGCYILLFTLISWSFYKKKVDVPAILVFVTTLIGACINAFAPGNFVRQDGQATEKIGIVKAVILELSIMKTEGKWLVLHTVFIAFVLLALIWGSSLKRKINILNLIVASLFCLSLPVVTMFPVVLGYGDITYKDISNRGFAMMDISIIIGATFMAVLWGVFFRGVIGINGKKIAIKLITIVVLADIILCGQKFSELVPVKISSNLYSGYNQEFFDAWMYIFEECDKNPDEDVIIELSVPPRSAGCSWAKLSDDPDKWWNKTIAQYYGLNSLTLINTYDD